MNRFPAARLVVALIAAVALPSLPARAVAAEEVDQANVVDTGQRNYASTLGQTFTVGKSGRLTSVDIWTENLRGVGPLTVQIRPLNGEVPGTTVLASATVTTNQYGGRVRFAQNPWVIAGERYALVLTIAGDQGWFSFTGDGTTYPAGRLWSIIDGSATNWTARDRDDYDLVFRTYVDRTPDALPPATVVDVAGTAGGSGWLRGSPTLSATAADTESGVAETRCWVNVASAPVFTTAGSQACTGPVPDGAYTIYGASRDRWGNTETPAGRQFKIDTQPPSTTVNGIESWSTAPPAVTFTVTDATSGPGTVRYSVGANPGAPATTYDPASPPVLGDGDRIRWTASDVAGNTADGISDTVRVDSVAPTTTASGVSAGWTTTAQPVTLTATDATSGVATIRYTLCDGAPDTVYDPADKPALADGQRIRFQAVDVAGNVEAVQTSAEAHVDGAVPETTLETSIAAFTADAAPAIAFSTTAPGAGFECALDGAELSSCTSPFVPAGRLSDGPHTFAVRAVSRAGVLDPTPATAGFVVDTAAPAAPTFTEQPDATTADTTARFAYAAEQNATLRCAVDDGPAADCADTLVLEQVAVGPHTLRVTARDRAGNESVAATVAWTVTQVIAAPTPTPTATPGPPLAAQALSFTLAGKGRQLLLSKKRVPFLVDCGGVACSVTVAAEIRVKSRRFKLRRSKPLCPPARRRAWTSSRPTRCAPRSAGSSASAAPRRPCATRSRRPGPPGHA